VYVWGAATYARSVRWRRAAFVRHLLLTIVVRLGLLAVVTVILDRLVGDSLNAFLASAPAIIVLPASAVIIFLALRSNRRMWRRYHENMAARLAAMSLGTPRELKALLDEIQPLWNTNPAAAEQRLRAYRRQHPGHAPSRLEQISEELAADPVLSPRRRRQLEEELATEIWALERTLKDVRRDHAVAAAFPDDVAREFEGQLEGLRRLKKQVARRGPARPMK